MIECPKCGFEEPHVINIERLQNEIERLKQISNRSTSDAIREVEQTLRGESNKTSAKSRKEPHKIKIVPIPPTEEQSWAMEGSGAGTLRSMLIAGVKIISIIFAKSGRSEK